MAVISEHARVGISERYQNVLSFHQESSAGRVLLSYAGDITQQKVDTLLRASEFAIIDNGSKRMVMKRVCSVIIEGLQNAALHGAKDEQGNISSFYVLKSNNSSYTISIGNLVLAQDALNTTARMDELALKSLPELRKLYIETLCNDNFTSKGGAGLGFLTMAKRADQPMKHSIDFIDERFAFLIITISVSH
ncbi:MAG: hypothetical protein RL226_1262 [Bacteroidota bacterium]|jgi:hypothetical protein